MSEWPKEHLKSIRVRNFKAVADTRRLPLTPLTVFIGNNGSGKSSIVESLQTIQRLAAVGLDEAMQTFKGMEHVKHKRDTPTRRGTSGTGEFRGHHAMEFRLDCRAHPYGDSGDRPVRVQTSTRINELNQFNRYVVEEDVAVVNGQRVSTHYGDHVGEPSSGLVGLSRALGFYIARWQFLVANPAVMGDPAPTRRTKGAFLLRPDGSNLADYLWHLWNDFGERGTAALNGIVEAMRYVLPYAREIGIQETSEIQRSSLLAMQETGFDVPVPGWMLSTGTMRVLALLALFRHPEPAPLICIEEIENGFDPRTLRMVVDEIQGLITLRRSQVILTTHSPHLLDLLPLSSIIMTERSKDGVTFTRPADDQSVMEWAKDFAPGQLYLMGRFRSTGEE